MKKSSYQKFEGTFSSRWLTVQFSDVLGNLVMNYPLNPKLGDDFLLFSKPNKKDQFRIPVEEGYGAPSEFVEFKKQKGSGKYIPVFADIPLKEHTEYLKFLQANT